MKGNYEKLYAFAQLKNKPNSKPVLSAVEWANFTIPHPHTPSPSTTKNCPFSAT